MKEYIITLMARDRVGIIADVAAAAAELGGNITNASQTVLRDYFTLIFSVVAPKNVSADELKNAIMAAGDSGEFGVNIRTYEPCDTPQSVGERFVLTLQGKDKVGIIARISAFLSQKKINIEDFYSYIYNDNLLILAEITIPDTLDINLLQGELTEVGKDFDISIHLQHENIFKATSEISAIMNLKGVK